MMRLTLLGLCLIGTSGASKLGGAPVPIGLKPKGGPTEQLTAFDCYAIESEKDCANPCHWDEYGCYFEGHKASESANRPLTPAASAPGCQTDAYLGFDGGSLTG